MKRVVNEQGDLILQLGRVRSKKKKRTKKEHPPGHRDHLDKVCERTRPTSYSPFAPASIDVSYSYINKTIPMLHKHRHTDRQTDR